MLEWIHHALADEAVIRHFTELNNEDAKKYGIIGLVHDIDFDEGQLKKLQEIEHNYTVVIVIPISTCYNYYN